VTHKTAEHKRPQTLVPGTWAYALWTRRRRKVSLFVNATPPLRPVESSMPNPWAGKKRR
jgi:hypothetical protein